MTRSAHVFGGPWTAQKLAVLAKYLSAYSTALSKQHFRTAYVDAFAGSGDREDSATARAEAEAQTHIDGEQVQQPLPINGEDEQPVAEFLDGSVRVALRCEPRFDRYIFIEKNLARCRELERLKEEFPECAARIRVQRGDANAEIQTLCRKNWATRRAVLFLDPYGMQVQWSTIESIAATKAIDLWVLFPLGGVNRMLTQSGEIPAGWRARLDELFGSTDWYERLYRSETSESLFDEPMERMVKAGTAAISEYFMERLRRCFAAVAPKPMVLRNSKNSPLYLFCFAASNPNGAAVALKIANHILKMGS